MKIDGHVVRRAEARVQRVGAARRERGDGLGFETLGPLHHRVTLDVDAAPPRATGQLRVLPRRDGDTRLAVELLELLQHHGAGRHVDAERERLGGEDHLDELAAEELFDDLLERREEPGVVRRDAPLEVLTPLPEVQDREILVLERVGQFLHHAADLGAFLREVSRTSARRSC